MLVNLYAAASARLLATSVVTAARSPLAATDTGNGSSTAAQVVDVGGGWHLSTWRHALRGLAHRRTVTALGLRVQPGEPRLTDADWQRVARHAADRAGIAAQPWAAIQTGPTTVLLLTETPARPLHLDAVRAYARTAATRPPRRPAVADRHSDGGIAAMPQPASTAHVAAAGVVQLNFVGPPETTTDPPSPARPAPLASIHHRHRR